MVYPFKAFMYSTDILRMCMWKVDNKHIIFDKFTAFLVISQHYTYQIMVDSAYFVKSTPPKSFIVAF